jgi:hypothetical protein
MYFSRIASAAALMSVALAVPQQNKANNGGNNGGNTGNGGTGTAASGSTGTTLQANAIQSGSFADGSNEIGSAEVGQAKSATSQNNFINFCSGQTLTNGLQITTGSCNGIRK